MQTPEKLEWVLPRTDDPLEMPNRGSSNARPEIDFDRRIEQLLTAVDKAVARVDSRANRTASYAERRETAEDAAARAERGDEPVPAPSDAAE